MAGTESYVRSSDGERMIAVTPHNYVSEKWLIANGFKVVTQSLN